MTTPRQRFLLFILGSGFAASAPAQSTLASLRGTVHDASGALIPNATVVVHRVESNTDRTFTSDGNGQYTAVNLDPGTYELRINAKGFRAETDTNIKLDTRQQLVFDVVLEIPNGNESVTVNASDAGTINAADSSISAALSTEAVQDLPANYRGAGSTSPLNVIQTLPGVQPDSGSYPPQPSASPNPAIKFSIQGGLPSQSETTVDGISAQNQTSNNILGDAFPSAEAIAEIRVDGVNNNAEYAQPGEITTITKSGTNHVHGSAYEYFQNSGFDAIPYGYSQASKPKKVANDFGASLGGPVVIPHLYNGRDRTFFFGDYEGLRYATARGVQYVVPTAQMRMGDFSQEAASPNGAGIHNPFTGAPYLNNRLTPNASSAALLGLFPLPNFHVGEAVADVLNEQNIPYNYVSTKRNDINSNQYDIRVDQVIGSKGSLFARYTDKSIDQTLPEDLALPNGTSFAKYHIFATSFTYALTARLANEARFGFTLEQDGQQNSFNGAAFTAAANLKGLPGAFFNGVPHLGFQQISSGGLRLDMSERSRLFQYVDNLTYSRGNHTVRLGADIRTLTAFTPLSFSPSDNYGNFYFQQNGSYTGNEFADFLAGTPYLTQVANVTTDNNGAAQAYAVYLQDSWKTTDRLTLTFGLRYELHPAFHSTNGDIGNFDPSVAKSGRLIYPNGYASLLSGPELDGFNACPTAGVVGQMGTGGVVNSAPCTPVLSNSQAGLPSGLRTTPRLRAEPRFGFAYRPFGNERTAIRGGANYFNITTSGALFYALTGTLQSNLNNYYSGATPTYSFPNLPSGAVNATPGTGVFYAAVDTNWHDPYSLQTNLSIDQDLGHNFGLRVSYIGLQTWHLVWQPELNQLAPSTTKVAGDQPRSAFPFPNFQAIYDRATSATANYHSGQVELNHRFVHGVSFNAGYTFAKSLADNQGTYGAANGQSSFVDEQGGYDATSNTNRHLDYGNVVGTRRHRLIASSVYELPYGKGRRFGGNSSRVVDLVAGGWQFAGIFALQSGPALTAFIPSGNTDPSGTGSGTLYSRQQRPDRVASAKLNGRNRNQWINTAAFTCPGGKGIVQGNTVPGVLPTPGTVVTGAASLQNGACVVGGYSTVNGVTTPANPIGRYGTESIGDITGPGLVSLSTGLSKTFRITEAVHFRLEGTFTNVLNHTNLGDPNLDATSPSFGVISTSRGSDFSGSRTGQVSGRIEF